MNTEAPIKLEATILKNRSLHQTNNNRTHPLPVELMEGYGGRSTLYKEYVVEV